MTNCEACPLTYNPVSGDGPRSASVLLLGEAPGYNEDRTGIPFVGDAGKELNKLLQLAELSRDEVYVDNIVACRPPGNKLKSRVPIRCCSPRLESLGVDPEVVVLMGSTPISVYGDGLSLKANHGLVFEREVLGKIRKVVVMYHPAAMLHKPALRAVIQEDWQRLPERIEAGGQLVFIPREYTTCKKVILNGGITAFDTETEYLSALNAPLIGISLASDDRAFWAPEVDFGKEEKTLVAWNLKYDYHVLTRNGYSFDGYQLVDGMIAAYLTGETSLGLKPMAKRYL